MLGPMKPNCYAYMSVKTDPIDTVTLHVHWHGEERSRRWPAICVELFFGGVVISYMERIIYGYNDGKKVVRHWDSCSSICV